MKKFFTMIMLLNLSLASFSQQTNPSTALNKVDYLLRSRHQKTLAILLVSTRGVVTVIALITGAVGGAANEISNAGGSGDIVPHTHVGLIIGLAAIAGSIPLFIASSRNKMRGMGLSVGNQTVPRILNQSSVYRFVPSLKLKIDL